MARLLMPFRLMAPVATTSSCRRASSGWTSTSMLSEYSRVKWGMSYLFKNHRKQGDSHFSRCFHRARVIQSDCHLLLHGRRAVLMERLDRLQAPCLALLAFCLVPHNWLPIRCKDEARACVGNFKTIAARFIHVQEECLLDGVFMRT